MTSLQDAFTDTVKLAVKCLILLFQHLLDKMLSYVQPCYKDISNDKILITGAASGLGRLMCLEFARYCRNIAALDCDSSGLSETYRIVHEATGCQIKTYQCNLRDKKSIDETTKRILEDFDRITILVNNAGVVNGDEYLQLSAEKITKCFEVNVFSHFYLNQAFLPGMLGKSGKLFSVTDSKYQDLEPRGHLVTIASVAGDIPGVGLSDYCASKAATLLAAESLELELGKRGLSDKIIVTRILPFLMNTTMFDGCDPDNQWLFPVVSAEQCAERTVEAVRLNDRVVYVTKRFRFLKLVKYLMPTKVLYEVYSFGGAYKLAEQLRLARTKLKLL